MVVDELLRLAGSQYGREIGEDDSLARNKDEELDGRQVECRKMFLRLLPLCIAEMKLMIGFVFVQEFWQVRICWWMSCSGVDGMEMVENLFFLRRKKAKTEMTKMMELWSGRV
jgi:hypothetical protein